jgi:glyoxylase-like metal-dependent hydrolase (beta-lactamase superfamily II)
MTTLTGTGTTLTVETFRAPDEGCLGYLVVDEASRAALAIDPRRDQVGAFVDALGARGLRLAYALDTHTHADYLSGARALAQRTGATLLAHDASKIKVPVQRVRGGSRLELGGVSVELLDAPGHTPDSLAVLVEDHLFTGDALFAGGAGRTDFMGGSASDLFDTFRRFERLPDSTLVHPGHDYVGRAVTTIGEEKTRNALFAERDRAALVARLASKTPPPVNMAAMLRHNLGESETATIEARELRALVTDGAAPWLLDVRTPIEFESEHIDDSRNIPLDALDAQVDEIPEAADVVVICRTGVRATIAAEALARAGRRSRVLEGGVQAWRRARLPLREGRKRLPVDRQVQLIAGSMVLTGVALGTLVNPWWLALSAFFGAGLTFAGATGTCGLAVVLLKMPWNRFVAPPPAGGGSVCAAGGPPVSTCAAPTSSGSA